MNIFKKFWNFLFGSKEEKIGSKEEKKECTCASLRKALICEDCGRIH
jgi:hypothetical protein